MDLDADERPVVELEDAGTIQRKDVKEKKHKKKKKKKKEKEKEKDKKKKKSKKNENSKVGTKKRKAEETLSEENELVSGKKAKKRPAMRSGEVEAFREKKQIRVIGEDVPAPFVTFEMAREDFDEVALPVLNVCCKGFEEPSPIQAQAWPIVLSGKDMVGVAETGSGKTLAFLLPGICRILRGKCGQGAVCTPRALVLSPTRELAMQSAEVAELACSACPKLSCSVAYGGQPKWEQRKKLESLSTLDILVATPGRLLDFVQSRVLDLSNVHYLVLDEADRMLDMGFELDVKKIIGMTVPASKGRQTVMFSATWPEEIRNLASSFMVDPMRVVIGSEKLSASHSVEQIVEVIDHTVKEKRLIQLLREIHDGKNRILVFALYKKEATRLENLLHRNKFNVIGVSGDKMQSKREEAIQQFKDGSTPILVATDVASRGLDIDGVEYVVNVTFPLTVEDYVHRIGRTGRAGAKGVAYTFFTDREKHLAGALQNVLREAGATIPPDLAKFGNTVKKKQHKLYGTDYKQITGPVKKPTQIVFESSDEEDE